MNNQKEYWNKKIIDWEKTIYIKNDKTKQNILEKLATPFRRILKKRMEVAEFLLSDKIENKTVADLGCGTGILLFNLAKYNPRKLIGYDISEDAVKIANKKIEQMNLQDKFKFVCVDLRKEYVFLENIDYFVGVGFIDYFTPDELLTLFKNLNGKPFLFSFPEKKLTPRELLHKVYLKFSDCPGSFKYTKTEIEQILKKAGYNQCWYYDKESIRYITNI